jgi:predicted HTH domain antitoxin
MVLELDDLLPKKGYSEQDFRLDTAILLYQRQIASVTRAAKLAGVSKTDFEQILAQKGLLKNENKPLSANERMLATLPANDPLREALRHLQQDASLEDIMKAQGYKGTNWDRVHKLADDLAIEEPLELLLSQLKD